VTIDEIRRNPILNQDQRNAMEAVKSRDEGQTEKARQEGIVNDIRQNWDDNSSQDLADRTDIPLSLSKALMSMKKAREDAKASTSAEENARIDRVMKDAVPGLSGMSDKDIEALPLPFKMHKVLKDMRNGINDRTARAEATAADKASLKAFQAYNARLADDPQSVTQAEVLSDKTLKKEDQTTILARIKAFGPKPIATTQASAGVSNELYRRMNLPPDDPKRVNDISEIMNAFSSGNLTRADHDWLIKQYIDAKTNTGVKLDTARTDFWKGNSGFISRSIVGKQLDTVGEIKLWEAQQWAAAREAQYRKEGKDPRNLYIPAHQDGKEFLQNIRSFKPSMKEVMDGMSGISGGEKNFQPPSLNQSLWDRFAKPAEAQPDAPKPPAALPSGAVFGGYAEDGRSIWFSADGKRKWFSK
jgi:hypothetical protein